MSWFGIWTAIRGPQWWPYVAAAGAVLLGVFGVYRAGKSSARDEIELEDKTNALDTHKRAADAVRKDERDRRSAADRLRSRGRLRD